jgi:peptide/nickel transport system permease protein
VANNDQLTKGPDPTPADTTSEPPATRRFLRWRLIIPGFMVAVFVLTAVFGPMIVEYNPVRTNTGDRLLPPGATLSTGERTWLGTDQVGRDVFEQVVEGARISLLVASTTIVIGGAIGLVLGMVSGYFGGWLDTVTMRVADMQLAFPSILLAILIAGVLGPSVLNVIIVLAITRWVLFARVVRSSTLATKGRDFVDSSRVIGASNFRILRKYIFPSVVPPLLIIATAQVGLMIIAESSLSFLGLGVPLNQPSWGSIIANGRDYIPSAWWIATMPGIALVLAVVSIGFLSDALRDLLDPNVEVKIR